MVGVGPDLQESKKGRHWYGFARDKKKLDTGPDLQETKKVDIGPDLHESKKRSYWSGFTRW